MITEQQQIQKVFAGSDGKIRKREANDGKRSINSSEVYFWAIQRLLLRAFDDCYRRATRLQFSVSRIQLWGSSGFVSGFQRTHNSGACGFRL